MRDEKLIGREAECEHMSAAITEKNAQLIVVY